MTIYTVTGLGYGDEGKGTTVDFLARQAKSLVVRHNGGNQAGHNVVLNNGKHHEFSQFGSGTFAGSDTFLSKHMLINPGDMLLEAEHLNSLGVNDLWERMHIDLEARVITPFHVALNRMMAYARGESCGKGIGEAMRQDLDRPDLTIRVKDVLFLNVAFVSLTQKLEDLREYLLRFSYRIAGYTWGPTPKPDEAILKDEHLPSKLAEDYWDWRALGWKAVEGRQFLTAALRLDPYEHIIFEGAQGVLLDEHHGFHPFTTWSTTTDANALSLLKEAGWGGPVERLGVTRAYATRHGVGPFVSEDSSLHFEEPHNTTGQFQGAFRQGHLDLVALRYARGVMYNENHSLKLVVTHLDRAESWNVVDDYHTRQFHNIHDIAFRSNPKNLARQEELTKQLMTTVPVYGNGTFISADVIALLENIAPVAVASYGPTAKDKTWIIQVVSA
jgi:adenylosuccinate synthase